MVAALLMLGASPAAACSPPASAVFDWVLDPEVETGETYLGVVERRVLAHAPPVPIVSSSRSVWVGSRVWGDVSGVDTSARRHGSYLGDLWEFVSFCPASPSPRTGDSTMSVVVGSPSRGPTTVWLAESHNSFDPTFEGGLTTAQEEALSARFGPPRFLDDPTRVSQVLLWLWTWQTWIILGTAFVGFVMLLRLWRRGSRGSVHDSGSPLSSV